MSYGCFKLARHPWDTTHAFVSVAYAPKVAIRLRGVGVPLDGCEISASYGRKWRDGRGTHALVEVSFNERTRRYFADRATARDLALLVRSRKMQSIRRATGAELRRRLRAAYGDVLVELPRADASPPVGDVGFWIAGDRTTFVERSATGARFHVTLVGGKIRSHNLRRLAFVF